MTSNKSDPFDEHKNYLNIKGSLAASRMLVDRIMPILPGNGQLILFRIYRQTIGYKNSDKTDEAKVWDTIAHGQLQEWCHIRSRNTVKNSISLLQELDLIDVKGTGSNQADRYRINLDEFDKYDDPDYEHPSYQDLV